MRNLHNLVDIKMGKCTPEMFQLKADLRKWGRTTQILNEMNDEINKMEKSFRAIEENTALQGEKGKYIRKSCQERISNLTKEAEELMEFANKMDSIVSLLKDEEQMYIRMRYQKGLGFDAISLKMFISRATVFRLQEKCLVHMLEIINEKEGAEKCM